MNPKPSPAMPSVVISSVKPAYQSKTLWFNGAVAVLAALEAQSGLLQSILPGPVYGYGMVLLTVGNTLLRLTTTQGLRH